MFTLGVFALVTLALARGTRLTTSDRLFLGYRRHIVDKYGDQSLQAYWVHCVWCTGMLYAIPAAILWATTTLPHQQWWLALPAWFAMSYLVGLLNRLEGD